MQEQILGQQLRGSTILVSGSTGLVGSAVVRALMRLNDRMGCANKIIALYRSEIWRDRLFRGYLEREDIQFLRWDLETGVPLQGDVDFIVHAAGISGGMRMHLYNPIKMFDVGVLGTKTLLEFAVRHHCAGFLYLSSYEVYGEEALGSRVRESQACHVPPLSTRSFHPVIKVACEALAGAYAAQHGLEIFSARLASTFGTGVRYDDPRFFAEFGRCIVENRDIVLHTAGTTVRSYLDVDDAARALLFILTCGHSRNAYNVTNMANEISIRNLARKMVDVATSPIEVVIEESENPQLLGYRKVGRLVMDASKIESLGWKPIFTLEDTIHSLLGWMARERTGEIGGDIHAV